MWDGIPFDMGPDHRVALKAVGLHIRLCKVIGSLQAGGVRGAAKNLKRLVRLLVATAELSPRLAGREELQKGALPWVAGMTLKKHVDKAGIVIRRFIRVDGVSIDFD